MICEYVYGIIDSAASLLKIGQWTGSIPALHSRYKMYYGEIEMMIFETLKGTSPLIEAQLHKACDQFRISGELFTTEAVPRFLDFAHVACLDSCRSTAMQERSRRLENVKLNKRVHITLS